MLKTFEGFDHYKEKDLSGWVPADSIPLEVWAEALSKPMPHIQGFNIITDAFQHVPKTIHYHGVMLFPDKRGVRMVDRWLHGGIELRFRSMRTAKVFAKGWTDHD
jgi:hypothetical protein